LTEDKTVRHSFEENKTSQDY